MKRTGVSVFITIIIVCLLPLNARAAELLIPVGKVIGLELSDDTVTVAAFDDSIGAAARDAGLQIGDEIVKINSKPVDSAEDVRSVLAKCSGNVELIVSRAGKQHKLTLALQETDDGPRLGVYLRQGIAGIGTVTYYDPETKEFGSLGHGVSNAKGQLLEMSEGNAYSGKIISVTPGKIGTPGQLRGGAVSDDAVGILLKNTPQGVFGISRQGWAGEPLPVAAFDEIQTGPAVIRSTVEGESVREYSVEILKIYPSDRADGRNFLIRVTDPDLLAATGGIVQGMSGSPLLQNGKIIGAVTHVLVNDPTTGYGIFIENMLDAAG